MRSWAIAAMCLLVPVIASASGGVDAARRSVQASMLVTGRIAVNPDGSVYGYTLDHKDALPAAVVRLVAETVQAWKFTPVRVQGKPVLAKALMSLRIVAHQDKPKHFVASVSAAAFGDAAAESNGKCPPGECLTYRDRGVPRYPLRLVEAGVSGTVYLVVEVNRQGQVAYAAVRQVDLRRLADATQLKRWRQALGQASLQAAQHWTFNVPTVGKGADCQQWFVQVPVNFELTIGAPPSRAARYGHWDAYVPGPVNPIPWYPHLAGLVASSGGDAVPDSTDPFVQDPRFVLLTPASGEPLPSTAKAGQG